MKKIFLPLYKESDNRYYSLPCTPGYLYYLYTYITTDYDPSDTKLFTEQERVLNITFVVTDLKNKIAYIGEHYDDPDDIFFHTDAEDINETNSCKISIDNFQEFIQNWQQIKKELPPFAIIYRDDKGWVHCQGFQLKEDMEQFIQDAQQIVN
ncbi:hypothetical protein KBC04_00750 [Candidatus Babeliales bacterium]|nr:hypothetical protein [Candidatus Babeliales bacterium]MBP9843380.1 hypothetical protein [Candidatus Babeliales bacterium]